ncbi:MAG: acetoin dehydrogenase dihydrolipoyllysine-residue acetyltransferase subunit [Acuticoccus sp.]
MPTEVIMPKVDMDMDRGTIALWHAAEGDKVSKADPLFDIETDKAAMEVESPASGYLHHLSPPGSEIAIGHAVAWIFAEGEAVSPPPGAADDAPQAAAANAAPDADGKPAPAAAPAEPVPATDAVRATPAARRVAGKLGVDLRSLAGSGPRGRIQKCDVEAANARADTPPPAATPSAPSERSFLPGRAGDAAVQPVVFVHGFAADAAGWAPVERQLGKGRAVARIERPGHGRTPPAAVKSFADLAGHVLASFDALALDNVHLVGHSLGAALCLALAERRPDKVAALTLIAPAGLGPEIDGATLAGIARATRAESLAPWLKRLVADPELISWNYVQAAALARADAGLRAAQAEMMEAVFPDGVQAFDLRPALQGLDCPARIIWGRKDAIIPWRHALAAPGRVSLNLFEDIGHMPHIEAPAKIAKLLTT